MENRNILHRNYNHSKSKKKRLQVSLKVYEWKHAEWREAGTIFDQSNE